MYSRDADACWRPGRNEPRSTVRKLSLILALLSLATVLIVGVPLFLRTPVWVDVTYHDVSAWNILHGGVHYRDVFETNLPGMVWIHALLRPLIGWSHEAIRAMDLLVFGAILLVLTRFICASRIRGWPVGTGSAIQGVVNHRVRLQSQIWFLVAACLFYLFETEFIHCQRDGWMLLPAALATYLRIAPRRWYWSIVEGLLWGCAVWIKPHVLVPALLVWLVSLRFRTRHAAIRETFALLTGGLIAGGLGSAWLIRTGTWRPMWDVLLNWNQEYYSWSWANVWFKIRLVPGYFAPFSLLHFAAIPLAVVAQFRRNASRAILAALYLGWLAQATVIQKEFDYAHAPPTLLGLALLASYRWPVGPIFLVWCLTAGLLNETAGHAEWFTSLANRYPLAMRTAVPDHPIVQRERLGLWRRCWYDDSWELKDRLSFYPQIHCAPNWADLQRVADFLATKNLHDRELICWHDSTHPLYIWLGIKPGIRYPHVITAMKFKSKREQIRQETFASPARFVVSDLVPIWYLKPDLLDSLPPPGPANALPAAFPAWGSDVYPWNQPVVFRAGRYVVHEIREPKGKIDFPLPQGLWD